MRIFIYVLAALMFVFPALAQEGEELIGAGPKGRFTMEQSQDLALQVVPGEVLEIDSWWRDDRFFYAYTIAAHDDSVYEVEINTLTGAVIDIEIESLSATPQLPMSIIQQNTAKASAASYIASETFGRRKPVIKDTVFVVHNRKPAYKVTVKKSAKRYDVLVNAESGEIISTKEQ